ncbi:MAG: hypothetical protein AUK12_02870 [Candidatus Levybacteria bacterium CG2_30_37_29]|nr:MAG: hypothetical protein AUK12_02870 [Candidatus Levybacteria bacterium CG2_30_37_29]
MKIKFLTINILHGGTFWDNLVSFVHQQKPDIVFLQEVYNGHDQSLEKRFRTVDEFKKEFTFLSHAKFEPSLFDTNMGNIEWGNAVFSKFPISSSKALFFDIPLKPSPLVENEDPRQTPESMTCVEIDILGKILYGFNIHGIWDTHGNDTVRRFEMLTVVKGAIHGKSPAILAGDFNLSPITKFVDEIEKELTSVFGNSLSSTFNMMHKTKPGYATAVVDMVFVSYDIKVLSKEMPNVDVSDHMPLVAILEI